MRKKNSRLLGMLNVFRTASNRSDGKMTDLDDVISDESPNVDGSDSSNVVAQSENNPIQPDSDLVSSKDKEPSEKEDLKPESYGLEETAKEQEALDSEKDASLRLSPEINAQSDLKPVLNDKKSEPSISDPVAWLENRVLDRSTRQDTTWGNSLNLTGKVEYNIGNNKIVLHWKGNEVVVDQSQPKEVDCKIMLTNSAFEALKGGHLNPQIGICSGRIKVELFNDTATELAMYSFNMF